MEDLAKLLGLTDEETEVFAGRAPWDPYSDDKARRALCVTLREKLAAKGLIGLTHERGKGKTRALFFSGVQWAQD